MSLLSRMCFSSSIDVTVSKFSCSASSAPSGVCSFAFARCPLSAVGGFFHVARKIMALRRTIAQSRLTPFVPQQIRAAGDGQCSMEVLHDKVGFHDRVLYLSIRTWRRFGQRRIRTRRAVNPPGFSPFRSPIEQFLAGVVFASRPKCKAAVAGSVRDHPASAVYSEREALMRCVGAWRCPGAAVVRGAGTQAVASCDAPARAGAAPRPPGRVCRPGQPLGAGVVAHSLRGASARALAWGSRAGARATAGPMGACLMGAGSVGFDHRVPPIIRKSPQALAPQMHARPRSEGAD